MAFSHRRLQPRTIGRLFQELGGLTPNGMLGTWVLLNVFTGRMGKSKGRYPTSSAIGMLHMRTSNTRVSRMLCTLESISACATALHRYRGLMIGHA